MKTKRKRRFIIWGSILLFLIVLRLCLPLILLRYANHFLAHLNGYRGHVNDIDMSLYRGAYQLDSFYLNKLDSTTGKQTEFFKVGRIDLSVHWDALLDGKIVGNIRFYAPTLLFTKDKTELGQVAKDTNDFRRVLKHFMPLKVNRFEVFRGSIHYVDNTASPKVDVSLKDAYILATNLRNATDDKVKLPSTLQARANAYGGSLSLKMKLDGLAKQPTFDMNAEVKNANLVALNDFLKAYGKFDVSRGTLGLYSECAAADGKFKGYVKPIIKDLKVLGPEDKKDNIGQKAKEAVIGAAAWLLKNHKKEQVASKIPFEGSFKDPSVNNGEAIWELLKNAFIEALMPSVDNEINITSAENASLNPKKEGFFKRLFTSKKKREKQEQEGLAQYEKDQKDQEAQRRKTSLWQYSSVKR
jgi:hypothetical protein